MWRAIAWIVGLCRVAVGVGSISRVWVEGGSRQGTERIIRIRLWLMAAIAE